MFVALQCCCVHKVSIKYAYRAVSRARYANNKNNNSTAASHCGHQRHEYTCQQRMLTPTWAACHAAWHCRTAHQAPSQALVPRPAAAVAEHHIALTPDLVARP